MAQLDFTQSNFAQAYEATLVGPVFVPWVEVLFDKVSLTDGDSLLDIACGTGVVCRTAKTKLGASSRVVGIDMSSAMLEVARSISPTVEFREGNALALPLADHETFDVVICHQGIQFFPDKPKALEEMERALKPGGRIAIGAWSPAQDVPFYNDLQQVFERVVGPVRDQRYSFGEAKQLEALMQHVELRDIHVENMTRTVRFPDRNFLKMNAAALLTMSTASAKLDHAQREEALATIVKESAAVADKYADGDGMQFTASNIIGWASR